MAAVATIALVVSGSGLIAFAQTGAGAGRGPIFVPADAPVYVEARVDMPDGQDEALAQMLTAFPGFADSASLQTRIDEALDGMLAEASDGEVTFSEDISPWITGEVGLGVMDLSSAMASGEDPDFILGIGVSDTDAASRFVTLLLEQGGMELAEEQYGGFTIYTGGDDDVEVGGQDAALAVTDEFLLVATGSDLIRHSIDVLGGAQPSLAQDEQFQAGFARVPAGRLAAVWFDVAAFADLVAAAMAMGAQPGPGGEMAETLLQQLPQDMTMYLAAMPDGLTIEAFVTPAEGGIVPPVGQSDLAARFPATTQLYVETRDLGATVESSLQGLTSTMGSEAAEELEPIEGLLGVPLPQILDFVEDAALGAAVEDGGAWVGIAGEVTDETVAQERLERVLGAIGMAAASEDTGVEITETEVAGTTVTTFTLPEEATEDLPIGIGDTISVAVGDGMLLLGTGTFVADALTSDGTDSLGTSEGYVSALGTATSNSSVLYADIAGLLTTLDPLLSFVVDDWENISPWVQGLDRFVAVGTADEEVISARMTLYVAAAS